MNTTETTKQEVLATHIETVGKAFEQTVSSRQIAALGRNAHNFKYHPPTPDQAKLYEALRQKAKEYADVLVHLCPESRELSVALTDVESSVMWANAAIARNPCPPPPNPA